MNLEGLIDAVLTDDSDVFVFGAQTVIRKCVPDFFVLAFIFLKSLSSTYHDNHSKITIFRARDIDDHASVQLTQGGFLLVALLCGGDYDMVSCDTYAQFVDL